MVSVRVLAFAAQVAPSFCQGIDYQAQWEEFKVTYNRFYNGEDDENARFQIFKANVDFVNAENSKNQSFTRGINKFADRTDEEVAPLMSGVPSFSSVDSSEIRLPYLGEHSRRELYLPDSVDWTTKGAVTDVKDQKICGSCWAFSGTEALEGAQAVATGKLVSLSEQQAMQCSEGAIPGRGCQGGWSYRVFNYAVDNDMCTEASYPYQGVDTIPCFWNVNPPKCTEVGLSKDLVSGYKKVKPSSEEDLMSALAVQPVSVDVKTDGWLTYAGGVYTGCGSSPGTGHAVLAVGYTASYWKIKNSWGSSWGENGYIRLPRGTGGQGMCNLMAEPTYPVVSSAVVV